MSPQIYHAKFKKRLDYKTCIEGVTFRGSKAELEQGKSKVEMQVRVKQNSGQGEDADASSGKEDNNPLVQVSKWPTITTSNHQCRLLS